MRIATNMSSLTACYQLNKNDKGVSASMKRLSSGYKINNAGDDPVGAAISKKMKTQIRGLERANQNASDAISVVETADGTLSEISAMVQRIRELAVQGATDTYTDDDRESLMSEIEQLQTEIDRIANDTEFNTRSLLNGDLGRNTYTNRADVHVRYLSDGVPSGTYKLRVNAGSRSQFNISGMASTFTEAGTVSVNGVSFNVVAGDTFADVYDKFISTCDKLDITANNTTGTDVEFKSNYAGSQYPIEITASTPALEAQLGLGGATYTAGKDALVQPDENTIGGSGFSNGAIVVTDGNEATIKASGGFEMRVTLDDDMVGNGLRVQCYVLESGTMTIQMGANESQEMEIELPEISCETLGIEKINACTSKGCAKAIEYCDRALDFINQARSRIGAYENRLESTIASLDVTEENLTAALSRIEDVNMAEEMTRYTTLNVLSQAATSMLSQANQQPEKVLQLLQ